MINWSRTLEEDGRVNFIKGEIYCFTDPNVIFQHGVLKKAEYTIACICKKGEAEVEIDLFPTRVEPSSFLIILPEQIFCWNSFSNDFEGMFIVMSRLYLEKLNAPESLPTYLAIRLQNYYQLSPTALKAMQTLYEMVSHTLSITDESLNKRSITQHLIIAYFYDIGYYIHKLSTNEHETRDAVILEKFLLLVRKYCHKERSVNFYAGKLCITPKYLSTSVKNASNKTAGVWINSFVIQEAKTLIKSTDMSISEISYELGFPSPSFFGKFFKRSTGMSPKTYRDEG